MRDIYGIEVEGFFVERFINMCANKNVKLWGTNKLKSGIIQTNVTISELKTIKKIAKKTRCKIKIKSKKGIPFVIRKYKNRKVFIFLFFLLFFSIITLSNFIWNIEITGNNNISREELLNEIGEYGLKVGIMKSKVEKNKIKEKMRLNDSRIAWIEINIEGTNAKVEIAEAVQVPEIIDKNEYCDIVAEKEGIITKINVNNGTAAVKEGDIVEKGQKLINGWMEGQYTGIRYMHAMGNVEARVWYTEELEESFIQDEKIYTNTSENKYGVNINKNEINFYKSLSKFKNYDTIETKNKFKLLNNIYLPIEIKRITNYEYKIEKKEYTQEELEKKIIDELEEKMKKTIENKQISDRNINIEKTEDGLKIKLIYETIENIGIEQKIVS